jgi:hypothetical protein
VRNVFRAVLSKSNAGLGGAGILYHNGELWLGGGARFPAGQL